MKKLLLRSIVLAGSVLLLSASGVTAAAVQDGIGYTNDFSAQPPATDWSARTMGSSGLAGAGEITSAAALDAAVMTNSAALINLQLNLSTIDPPAEHPSARWCSTGAYLQTRPTANGATLLMLTLQNDSTTNATAIRVSYDYVTNRAALAAEEVRGQRVYYSLNGAAGSWMNIPALSQTTAGALSADVTLSGPWVTGTKLYLLWADDNGSGTPEDANNLDIFFAMIIAGALPQASCELTAPPNGSSFPETNSITLSAGAVGGVDATVTGVGFFEVSGGFLGSALTPPYTINVNLLAGIHQLYAVSTNSLDVVAFSATNTITVTNIPLALTLITPPPGAIVRYLTRIGVTFDQPVAGVDAGDLLVNDTPATQVSGTGAGPYTFVFSKPATGVVQVAFAPGNGIQGLGVPPSLVGNPTWSYTLNPALPVDIGVTRVVQISLDGLGAKYLERYVAGAPAQFPTFVRLMNEAAFTLNARCDHDISETVPNHATMFTARPVIQPAGLPLTTHHGYNNNFPMAAETFHNSGNTNVPYKFSMFDVAHDYGKTTAFYAGKTRLMVARRSYDAANGAADLVGADNGREKIDFASVADISGAAIAGQVDSVLANLTNASPRQYTFIHIAEPDLTGHSSSWGTANWSNMVRMVDAQLGRIINAIDANPALSNQTALIVTADHGGGGVSPNGHTESYHITNYTIPFFLRAPGISGGMNLYEVFSNRANPGTNRTDYTTQPQPIRNGDGSNLALALLGLPPIPGSFMVPAFASPEVTLHVARFGGQLGVFWNDPADEYLLEATDTLGAPSQWQTITNGITLQDTTKVLTILNVTSAPKVFFRLRKN